MQGSALQALEAHPFVAEFPPEHRARLASLVKEVRFAADQVIFREGDDYSVLTCWSRAWSRSSSSARARAARADPLRRRRVRLVGVAAATPASTSRRARSTPSRRSPSRASELLASFEGDPPFGLAFMLRLMGVVSERLRATRLQLLDMYSPVAKRAGA